MLQSDPCLAEVPGFTPDQLASLTRSVELKKQKLEDDIKHYIVRKQAELKNHEQELLAQYRSMDSPPPRNANGTAPNDSRSQSSDVNPPTATPTPTYLPALAPRASASQPADPSPSTDSKAPGPDEKAKRTKHTRVHKREKELFGLITPIFLPLLEAGDSPPTKKKLEKRKEKADVDVDANAVGQSPPNSELGSSSRDADKGKEKRRSRRHNEEKMERDDEVATIAGESSKENQKPDAKKKRSPIKKSSLRHNNTPMTRRKRVSLVIDDQIVLPADSIVEPPLTSPSETAISTTSNSTASLDELIDPQLLSPRHDTPTHQDPVHHSLPLNTTLPISSPTKHTGHTLSDSPPPLVYQPPQTSTQTYLDSSPTHPNVDIPQHSSSAHPIYASQPIDVEPEEEAFDTYVGGLSGSNVDNVDQAGSYGYPSSLGASYMESYMQSRPLSVRIAAAERAELAEDEKRKLLQGEAQEQEDLDLGTRKVDNMDVDDDMDVMGEMEGF